MTFRLEIRLKDALVDALGGGIQKKSKAYFDFDVDDVTSIALKWHVTLSVGQPDEARCYDIFSKLFEAKEA